MEKEIQEFDNKYGLSFVEDFLMQKENKLYFYIELSSKPLSASQIHVLKGKWIYFSDENCPNGYMTIDYLLNYFDMTCEHAEVRGQNVFFQEVYQEINQAQASYSVDIPIKIDKNRHWLGLRIRRFEKQNVAICSLKDVTPEKNQLEELYLTSYKDSLTGLFNRNTCIFHIDNIAENANVYIFMIDLDSFKVVNDTYGHNAGDVVLKNFVNKLMELVDDNRIFYRLSGDEFLIQVKNYNHQQAEDLAKTILDKARQINYEKISLTASVGIAKYKPEMKNLDVLRYADRAMYRAKERKDSFEFENE